MARKQPTEVVERNKKAAKKRLLEQYTHEDKDRLNNPPVGLVTPETDRDAGKKTYAYDPHLDPQLVWAGKAEHTSFEIPTVSLHVHKRIDPRTIIEACWTLHEIVDYIARLPARGNLPLRKVVLPNPRLAQTLRRSPRIAAGAALTL